MPKTFVYNSHPCKPSLQLSTLQVSILQPYANHTHERRATKACKNMVFISNMSDFEVNFLNTKICKNSILAQPDAPTLSH